MGEIADEMIDAYLDRYDRWLAGQDKRTERIEKELEETDKMLEINKGIIEW